MKRDVMSVAERLARKGIIPFTVAFPGKDCRGLRRNLFYSVRYVEVNDCTLDRLKIISTYGLTYYFLHVYNQSYM